MKYDIEQIFKRLADPIRATQDLYNTALQRFSTEIMSADVSKPDRIKIYTGVRPVPFIPAFNVYADYDQ